MDSPSVDEKTAIAKRFLNDKVADVPEDCAVYLAYYEKIFKGASGAHVVNVDPPAYSTHLEVIQFFNDLINDTTQTRAQCSGRFAAGVTTEAREDAVRALLQASLMIDCAAQQNLPEGRKVGDYVSRSWGEQQTFAEFVARCFPKPIASQESKSALSQRRRLKAWKLKARNKVRLRPTDDLAQHLVFDPERQILHVFRHVGYLKAHLYRSRDEDVKMGFPESLEKGTLPPQLLLEVLDSIQYLLFPNDIKSAKSLAIFIDKYEFDRKAQYYESHIRALPDDFEYQYLANRAAKLLNMVDNPPLGKTVRYLEKHTSPRHNVTIAVLGLFLTALMGFLGVLVGVVALIYSIKQYDMSLRGLQASSASP